MLWVAHLEPMHTRSSPFQMSLARFIRVAGDALISSAMSSPAFACASVMTHTGCGYSVLRVHHRRLPWTRSIRL